jgi:hypothetical protein
MLQGTCFIYHKIHNKSTDIFIRDSFLTFESFLRELFGNDATSLGFNGWNEVERQRSPRYKKR